MSWMSTELELSIKQLLREPTVLHPCKLPRVICYIVIYNGVLCNLHHHHYHVVLSARISLTLFRHPSLSPIASGKSSIQHPVSAQICSMLVRAGRPAFARPCDGVHRSRSLMISFLLLQQCPACLVRLILTAFLMGGRWPYSCYFVECYLQDLFNIARSILVFLLSSFFSIRLVSVHVVHPDSSIDTTAAWKKLRLILSVRSDFHMTGSLS